MPWIFNLIVSEKSLFIIGTEEKTRYFRFLGNPLKMNSRFSLPTAHCPLA